MRLDGFPFEGGKVTARMLKGRGMAFGDGDSLLEVQDRRIERWRNGGMGVAA